MGNYLNCILRGWGVRVHHFCFLFFSLGIQCIHQISSKIVCSIYKLSDNPEMNRFFNLLKSLCLYRFHNKAIRCFIKYLFSFHLPIFLWNLTREKIIPKSLYTPIWSIDLYPSKIKQHSCLYTFQVFLLDLARILLISPPSWPG